MIGVAFIFLILYYGYWRWTRRRMYQLSAPVPGIPMWPIIGNMHQFMGDSHNLLNILDKATVVAHENNGVMKFWFGPLLYYVITNPADAEIVTHKCADKDYIYTFGKGFLGDGLITAKGESEAPYGTGDLWKDHVKKVQPAFNQSVLDSFMGIFNEQSRLMVEQMRSEAGNSAFELEEYLGPVALETVCQTTMGVPLDGEDRLMDQTYFELVSSVLKLMAKRATTPYLHLDLIYYNCREGRKEKKYNRLFDQFTDRVLARKRAAIKKRQKDQDPNASEPAPRFKAFLDLILEHEAVDNFSDQEIRDEVKTMIVAGMETSVLSMRMMIVMIGAHHDVQEKMYQELLSIFGDSYREVEKADLSKLVYMEAVIKEVLRLYPPVACGARSVTKDLKITNWTIPAGAGAIVPAWGLNRSPQLWGSDVLEFRPERFLPPESMPKNPYAYGAFSFGKRACIGKNYGMMSMKTTLCNVMRIYKINSPDVGKLKFNLDTTLKPVEGHHVQLESRLALW